MSTFYRVSFHINGHVSGHRCWIYVAEQPHEVLEYVHDIPK
jgi:hypothetical protein